MSSKETIPVEVSWINLNGIRKTIKFDCAKVVGVKIDKPIVNIEQLPSGDFRLIMSDSLYEDVV